MDEMHAGKRIRALRERKAWTMRSPEAIDTSRSAEVPPSSTVMRIA